MRFSPAIVDADGLKQLRGPKRRCSRSYGRIRRVQTVIQAGPCHKFRAPHILKSSFFCGHCFLFHFLNGEKMKQRGSKVQGQGSTFVSRGATTFVNPGLPGLSEVGGTGPLILAVVACRAARCRNATQQVRTSLVGRNNVTERNGADGRRGPDVEDGKLRYGDVVDTENRLSRRIAAPSHLHVVRWISVYNTLPVTSSAAAKSPPEWAGNFLTARHSRGAVKCENWNVHGRAHTSDTSEWNRHSVVTGEQPVHRPKFSRTASLLVFPTSLSLSTSIDCCTVYRHDKLYRICSGSFPNISSTLLWSTIYLFPKVNENLPLSSWAILFINKHKQQHRQNGSGNTIKITNNW